MTENQDNIIILDSESIQQEDEQQNQAIQNKAMETEQNQKQQQNISQDNSIGINGNKYNKQKDEKNGKQIDQKNIIKDSNNLNKVKSSEILKDNIQVQNQFNKNQFKGDVQILNQSQSLTQNQSNQQQNQNQRKKQDFRKKENCDNYSAKNKIYEDQLNCWLDLEKNVQFKEIYIQEEKINVVDLEDEDDNEKKQQEENLENQNQQENWEKIFDIINYKFQCEIQKFDWKQLQNRFQQLFNDQYVLSDEYISEEEQKNDEIIILRHDEAKLVLGIEQVIDILSLLSEFGFYGDQKNAMIRPVDQGIWTINFYVWKLKGFM
ncbi:hypothetical protein PPERSA_10576 [Pseudocohnilembus persalinus]|uniref:Uncharacterized protein n=1 Tax=Pseudocohnilembus persalinus TaxID=266149 RepID=A0A0V0Q9E7_PSEPJ|nr:hypothetical protein PPERSA_10576 [Pseudocohnilembus persalinus]|eukprot:KRW98805.1 hypothetical protein PPERSA_10576 [Pseudocohnilembus persalinus]